MANEKILVVDDSAATRDLLFDILHSAGYEVEQACDGEEAYICTDQKQFDLVITDVQMPRCDGLELLRRLKEVQAETHVILVTGYGSVNTARDAMIDRAADFIKKPFKHQDILDSVERTLENGRQTREENRIKNTHALYNVSEEIRSSESLQENADNIMQAALDQTDATSAAMVVIQDGQYFLKTIVGQYEPSLVHNWEQYPVVQMIYRQSKPVLVTRSDNLAAIFDVLTTEYHTGFCPEFVPFENEMLFYPLLAGQDLLGFMILAKGNDKPSFTQSDMQLLTIMASQISVALYNGRLVQTLEQSYLNTLLSLTLILEAKDQYTKGHSHRVANLSLMIGREMGLTDHEMKVLRDGALLHDIGKVGVSEDILNKKGALNDEETEIVSRHPVIGDEILRPITFLEHARPIVRCHHEWVNGQGTPDGLTKAELTLPVMICSVADSIDAMSSRRSYRKPMSANKIRRELLNNAGTQFDEDVAEVALRFVRPDVLRRLDKPFI